MKLNHAALLLCGVLGALCAGPTARGDEAVRVDPQDPPFPLGHGDATLEFQGQKFLHLFSHGYVATPDHSGIIFVTQRAGHERMLHFVPFQGPPVEIGLNDSEFGIGLGFPKDDMYSHYIEGTSGGTIQFAAKFGPGATVHHYVLNLDKQTFVEVTGQAGAASN